MPVWARVLMASCFLAVIAVAGVLIFQERRISAGLAELSVTRAQLEEMGARLAEVEKREAPTLPAASFQEVAPVEKLVPESKPMEETFSILREALKVEKDAPVYLLGERVGKSGVAFQLRELEGGPKRPDHRVHQIGEDVLRMVELHSSQVPGVTRNVGDDETRRISR